MDTSVLPFAVGDQSTNPPFKNDLGKRYNSGNNVYRLVKAASAIAASSNGLQVSTPMTLGVPTFAVSLNGTRGNQNVCGAIPSTMTAAIAASAYFLVLMEGNDTLSQTGTAASAITSGSILIPGTASDLVRAATGVAAADIDEKVVAYCGFATVLNTGSTILPYATQYRAPVR